VRTPEKALSSRGPGWLARQRDNCHPLFSSWSTRPAPSACPRRAFSRIVRRDLSVSHRTRQNASRKPRTTHAPAQLHFRSVDPARAFGGEKEYPAHAFKSPRPTNLLTRSSAAAHFLRWCSPSAGRQQQTGRFHLRILHERQLASDDGSVCVEGVLHAEAVSTASTPILLAYPALRVLTTVVPLHTASSRDRSRPIAGASWLS